MGDCLKQLARLGQNRNKFAVKVVWSGHKGAYPPNSALSLQTFSWAPTQKFLLLSADWACKSAPKRAKDTYATCTYSDRAFHSACHRCWLGSQQAQCQSNLGSTFLASCRKMHFFFAGAPNSLVQWNLIYNYAMWKKYSSISICSFCWMLLY